MLKLKIEYPKREEEKQIIQRFSKERTNEPPLKKILSRDTIVQLRSLIDEIYVDENIQNYVLDIVFKTREKNLYIACGASPRASLSLIKASKCKAFMEGRNFVIPDDVKSIVYDVLRHRILLSYEAEAEDITSEDLITQILEKVNLP